jgi:hypothetical protein
MYFSFEVRGSSASLPTPNEAWWGHLRSPGKMLLGPSQSNLLRQRCDARGFKPLAIEIIEGRKVALAFERTACESHSPGRQCNSLFGGPIIQAKI